jgi:hypothetical protein
MENKFNNHTIPSDYFNSFYHHITHDLLIYICNNLHDENHLLKLDLQDALTNYANGEYI